MSFLSSITSGIKKVLTFDLQKEMQKTDPNAKVVQNIIPIGTNTGVLSSVASAVRGGIASVAKLFVPKTVTGVAVASVAVPVAGVAIASNPIGAVKNTFDFTKSVLNVEKNVGQAIANPSTSNIAKVVTENPKTSAFLGLVGITAVAKSVLPTVIAGSSVREQTEAIEKQTKAIKEATEEAKNNIPSGAIANPQGITIINQLPPTTPVVTPQAEVPTATITPVKKAVVKKKKKKTVKKKKKTTNKKKKVTAKKKKKSIKRRKK